jgi:glycosyltransferase involved in cell wall biosynthesis
MNLPNISILIPTYNRSKFISFIIKNLKVQDYPHKNIQVVIDDDGDEPLIKNYNQFKNAIHPMKLKYIRTENRVIGIPSVSIGFKRHRLIQNANNNIVAFMDDDDLYEPTYISHSYKTLIDNKAGCVGCDKMIILYPPYTKDDFYGLDAGSKRLIHEATMMFYKKWYNKTKGFINSNKAEALGVTKSCKLKTIALTCQYYTMTAIVHGNNTIEKDKFKNEDNKLEDIIISSKITDFINEVCSA